jgi:hypothetical protein
MLLLIGSGDRFGGAGGIRTLDTVNRIPDFESDTAPPPVTPDELQVIVFVEVFIVRPARLASPARPLRRKNPTHFPTATMARQLRAQRWSASLPTNSPWCRP